MQMSLVVAMAVIGGLENFAAAAIGAIIIEFILEMLRMRHQSIVRVNYAREWESEEVERGIWPMADVWTRLFFRRQEHNNATRSAGGYHL